MSFNFSQSLLGDMSQPQPFIGHGGGSFSQELENSQDSGYSVSGGCQMPNFYPRNSVAAPSFPTRRTLPRPPTWPNINVHQQPQRKIHNKWNFGGGRPEKEEKSALERDLQQHLQELSNQTTKIPGKLSTVVVESVKYLQDVLNKEGQDERQELNKVGTGLHELREHIEEKRENSMGITEDLEKLMTILSECEMLTKAIREVKERESGSVERIKEKIRRLTDTQTKIKDVVMKLRKSDNDYLTRKERMDKNLKRFTPSPNRQLLANPLPSIRRLPTLPLRSAVPVSATQGEMLGVRGGAVEFGRRAARMRAFVDMEE